VTSDRSNRTPERERRRKGGPGASRKPPLRLMTTTLWEYPSRTFDAWVDPNTGEVHRVAGGHVPDRGGRAARPAEDEQGSNEYTGSTPAWVIWQLLMRYTRENDLVLDPMAGSGTTLDVARMLGRRGLAYDLAPVRDDVFRADARDLPIEDGKADFVFIDPPYSTHIDYSDDPRCIGKLDAGAGDGGAAYYEAMRGVIAEAHRTMRNRRYLGLYVSDSWRKKKGQRDKATKGRRGSGGFMAIGFELYGILCEHFTPVDVICVVRHNAKLKRGNWHKAAAKENFFLRGFNYLFIMKKDTSARRSRAREEAAARPSAREARP